MPIDLESNEMIRSIIRKHVVEDWKIAVGQGKPCGDGSTYEVTANVRRFIEDTIEKYNIKSVSDAPCGDFRLWMYDVNYKDVTYVGYDLNGELTARNAESYPNKKFIEFDIVEQVLPKTDLIICRDCLFHLNLEEGTKVIENFKQSGSTYLMSTTFNLVLENMELPLDDSSGEASGFYGYREINLELPPYNLGAPLKIIDEWIEITKTMRQVGLWRLQ
jgi:hypothetical protein